MFTTPFAVKRNLEALGLGGSKAMISIENSIKELNETWHTGVENDFHPFIEKMLNNDLSFLRDQRQSVIFYNCLAIQYLRTNHLKKARMIMEPEEYAKYRRVANPLVHILAPNMGSSLYASSAIILTNNTETSFVTADQPVINMAANPKKIDPPECFDLYYPLSPTKALLLLEPTSEFWPFSCDVSEVLVEMYNLRMAAHSYRQVFSNSKQVLRSIQENLTAYLSCFDG